MGFALTLFETVFEELLVLFCECGVLGFHGGEAVHEAAHLIGQDVTHGDEAQEYVVLIVDDDVFVEAFFIFQFDE